MKRYAGILLVLAGGCTFDPGGFAAGASPADASGPIADADPAAPDSAAPAIDADPAAPDAANPAIDAAGAPDATIVIDATPPPPDADPCGDCDDGVSCTADICEVFTGTCQHTSTCAAGQVCDSGDDRCEGTVSFRNGAGGYTGTQDTSLRESDPGIVADNQTFGWDGSEPNGTDNRVIGLLQFEGIVGAGADQVPPGAVIVSATVELTVQNSNPASFGGDDTTIHELAVSWSEVTTNWNNIGGDPGLQASEIGAMVTDFAAVSCSTPCPLSIDVTASLERWAAAPADNFGWAFQTVGGNGLYVYSSERSTADQRPTLTVEYAVP